MEIGICLILSFFYYFVLKERLYSEKQHSLLSLTEEGNSLNSLRYCKDCA